MHHRSKQRCIVKASIGRHTVIEASQSGLEAIEAKHPGHRSNIGSIVHIEAQSTA
jgi:hypothetical protein